MVMSRMLRSLVTVFFTFCFSTYHLYAGVEVAVNDAAAALPDYRPGETFVFTNKRIARVEKIAGEWVTFSSRNGHRYVRHRNIVLPIMQWAIVGKNGKRALHGDAGALWPLAVGNRARFSVLTTIHDEEKKRNVKSAALWQCHVAALETVSVVAGVFSSYRIICDHYSAHSMRILKRYTWHYSPVVNHYVRREVTNFFTGERDHFELIATLPAEKSNALRIKALENMVY